MQTLGIEVLGVSPRSSPQACPETARALEAEAPNRFSAEAERRSTRGATLPSKQERASKENELNTEIAVEVKKRQIRETQMDAGARLCVGEAAPMEKMWDVGFQDRDRGAETRILTVLATVNAAPKRTRRLTRLGDMKALSAVDRRTLQALASVWGMDSSQLVALAFQGLRACGQDRFSSSSRRSPARALKRDASRPVERLTENKQILVTAGRGLDDPRRAFNTLQQAKFYVEHCGADFTDNLADTSSIPLRA
jgi:hypothetical protein